MQKMEKSSRLRQKKIRILSSDRSREALRLWRVSRILVLRRRENVAGDQIPVAITGVSVVPAVNRLETVDKRRSRTGWAHTRVCKSYLW